MHSNKQLNKDSNTPQTIASLWCLSAPLPHGPFPECSSQQSPYGIHLAQWSCWDAPGKASMLEGWAKETANVPSSPFGLNFTPCFQELISLKSWT